MSEILLIAFKSKDMIIYPQNLVIASKYTLLTKMKYQKSES